MFPNRINSSSPPPMTGGPENVPASSSGSSRPTPSRSKPRTLDDLPRYRATLLSSQNPAAVILGKGLERLLGEAVAKKITSGQHLAQCHEMLEAVEMLKEKAGVDKELMARHHLDGLPPGQHALNNEEFLAVNDELAVHLDSERGVQAVQQRTDVAASAGDRARASLMARIGANPEDIPSTPAAATAWQIDMQDLAHRRARTAANSAANPLF